MKKRSSLPRFPHQFFYFAGLRLRRLLVGFSERLVPHQMALYEKAQGFWVSRAIVAACDLSLAEHLSDGPKGIKELAVLTGSDETNLYRLMRMLAGEGVFRELPGKVFENNRLSDALKEGDGSVKHLILHQFSETNLKLFTEFKGVVQSGESHARKILGNPVFQFLRENPENNAVYNKSMDESSGMVALAVLSAYDFSKIHTLVDLGGGHGILLMHILAKYGNMQGILFDQAHVVEKSGELIRKSGMDGRVRVVPGSFFEDIPSGADAYFLKNILHAFNDEDCIMLLREIHDAMAPGARLIIMETVISPDNRPAMGKRLDLLMMIGTEGGKERTKEEFELLLDRSGFKHPAIFRTIAPFSLLESFKK